MSAEELAAIKGKADGEKAAEALIALNAYWTAFAAAAREAFDAQMPHAPAVAAVDATEDADGMASRAGQEAQCG